MLCYVVSYHTTDPGRSYLSSSQLTHIPNMFQPALVAMLRYQHSISVGFTSIVDFHFEAKTVQYYLPWIPQPHITTEFIIMTRFGLKTIICICQIPFVMPKPMVSQMVKDMLSHNHFQVYCRLHDMDSLTHKVKYMTHMSKKCVASPYPT